METMNVEYDELEEQSEMNEEIYVEEEFETVLESNQFNDRVHIGVNTGVAQSPRFTSIAIARTHARYRVNLSGFQGMRTVNIGARVLDRTGRIIAVNGLYRMNVGQGSTFDFMIPAHLRGTGHRIEFRASTNTQVANRPSSLQVNIQALSFLIAKSDKS